MSQDIPRLHLQKRQIFGTMWGIFKPYTITDCALYFARNRFTNVRECLFLCFHASCTRFLHGIHEDAGNLTVLKPTNSAISVTFHPHCLQYNRNWNVVVQRAVL